MPEDKYTRVTSDMTFEQFRQLFWVLDTFKRYAPGTPENIVAKNSVESISFVFHQTGSPGQATGSRAVSVYMGDSQQWLTASSQFAAIGYAVKEHGPKEACEVLVTKYGWIRDSDDGSVYRAFGTTDDPSVLIRLRPRHAGLELRIEHNMCVSEDNEPRLP